MFRWIHYLIALTFLSPSLVVAEIQPHAQHWDTIDGLVDDIVYSVAEDELGRVWLATPSGVSIVDGLGVTNLSNDASTQGSLRSDVITRIVPFNGDMYVLGLHGIDVVDPITMSIRAVDTPDNAINKANHLIFPSRQYAYLVADDHLWKWEVETNDFSHIELPNNDEVAIAVKKKNDEQLLVFTNQSFFNLELATDEFQSVNTENISPLENDIRFYFTDSQERLWLSVYGQGIFVFADGRQVAHFQTSNNTLTSNLVSTILEREGQVYAITRRGVTYFDVDSLTLQEKIFPTSNNNAYLSSDMALTGTFHSDGNLMVGTTNGFYSFPIASANYVKLTELIGKEQFLLSSIFTHENQLVSRIDSRYWETYLNDFGNLQLQEKGAAGASLNPLGRNGSYFLFEDNQVGIYDEKIELLTIVSPYDEVSITGIFESDHSERVFLTTRTHLLEARKRGFELEVLRARRIDSIVVADLEQFDEKIYIASRGAGVLSIEYDDLDDASIPFKRIDGPQVPYELFIDSEHRLWALTLEDGIYYQHINAQETMSSMQYFASGSQNFNPTCIAEDYQGDIWMASQWSVGEWTNALEQKARFTSRDGISPATINRYQCGSFQDKVYFATSNDVYIFNAQQDAQQLNPPSIELSRLQTDNRSYSPNASHSFIEPSLLRFSFYSSNLSLEPEYRLYYRVKEKGVEEEGLGSQWNLATTKEIMLIKPSLGNFVLETKISIHDGIESPVNQIPFTIRQPFYATTTMIVIYAFLIILVIVLVLGRQLRLSNSLLTMTQAREEQQKRYSEELTQEVANKTQQYKNQRQIAIKANIEKTRFIASASHDLRAPLHSMRLKLESLLGMERNEKNRLISEFEHLDNLVDSIVNLAKFDANIITPSMDPVDLVAVANECVKRFEPLIEDKKLNVVVSTTPSQNWVISDRMLLSRLLLNLIDNAIKNCPNSADITISLADKSSSKLLLEVKDTGPGIPDSIRDKLFSSFIRGTTLYSGTGLGLTIVKQIADMLQLDIELSTSEEGTSFFLTFEKAAPTIHHQQDEETSEKPTALVIDDDPYYAHTTEKLLANMGFSVTVVNDVRNAQWKFCKAHYNLVICDFNLGIEQKGHQVVLDLIASDGITTDQVIIMSEDHQARIITNAESDFHFLAKPIKRSKLSWLAQRQNSGNHHE